jgi:hypothetical protein
VPVFVLTTYLARQPDVHAKSETGKKGLSKKAMLGGVGGIAVGGVLAIADMIPDPTDAFPDVSNLPAFLSANEVKDGLDRLRGLSSELHDVLAALLARYMDAITDGADAPVDDWEPKPDASSAVWDSLYQELLDL